MNNAFYFVRPLLMLIGSEKAHWLRPYNIGKMKDLAAGSCSVTNGTWICKKIIALKTCHFTHSCLTDPRNCNTLVFVNITLCWDNQTRVNILAKHPYSWVRNRSSITVLCECFFSPDSSSGWKNRKNEPPCISQKFGQKFLQPFLGFCYFWQICLISGIFNLSKYGHITHRWIRNFTLNNYFNRNMA